MSFLGAENLVQSIINYSTNRSQKKLDKKIITQKLMEVHKEFYDIYQLVNGHDLSNILFILMKKILRSNSKMLNDYNCVEDSLILAYDFNDFKKTNLYKDLIEWFKKETNDFDGQESFIAS